MTLSAGSVASGLQWVVQDNFFDTVTTTSSGGSKLTNSYNGYRSTTLLPSPTTGNVMVTNVAYVRGPLADYYYPTNGGVGTLTSLINAGSQNATNTGLYHFVTTVDFKETNSVVDIGWHLIGLNASWTTAADSDGDGIPDYAEDANGNGSVDSGETDWQNGNDWGLKVFITRPRQGASIP